MGFTRPNKFGKGRTVVVDSFDFDIERVGWSSSQYMNRGGYMA